MSVPQNSSWYSREGNLPFTDHNKNDLWLVGRSWVQSPEGGCAFVSHVNENFLHTHTFHLLVDLVVQHALIFAFGYTVAENDNPLRNVTVETPPEIGDRVL